MKTIKITLPADNISITTGKGVSVIGYDGIYAGIPKRYGYEVIGEFYEYTLTENLLTLK